MLKSLFWKQTLINGELHWNKKQLYSEMQLVEAQLQRKENVMLQGHFALL